MDNKGVEKGWMYRPRAHENLAILEDWSNPREVRLRAAAEYAALSPAVPAAVAQHLLLRLLYSNKGAISHQIRTCTSGEEKPTIGLPSAHAAEAVIKKVSATGEPERMVILTGILSKIYTADYSEDYSGFSESELGIVMKAAGSAIEMIEMEDSPKEKAALYAELTSSLVSLRLHINSLEAGKTERKDTSHEWSGTAFGKTLDDTLDLAVGSVRDYMRLSTGDSGKSPLDLPDRFKDIVFIDGKRALVGMEILALAGDFTSMQTLSRLKELHPEHQWELENFVKSAILRLINTPGWGDSEGIKGAAYRLEAYTKHELARALKDSPHSLAERARIVEDLGLFADRERKKPFIALTEDDASREYAKKDIIKDVIKMRVGILRFMAQMEPLPDMRQDWQSLMCDLAQCPEMDLSDVLNPLVHDVADRSIALPMPVKNRMREIDRLNVEMHRGIPLDIIAEAGSAGLYKLLALIEAKGLEYSDMVAQFMAKRVIESPPSERKNLSRNQKYLNIIKIYLNASLSALDPDLLVAANNKLADMHAQDLIAGNHFQAGCSMLAELSQADRGFIRALEEQFGAKAEEKRYRGSGPVL